MSCEVEIALSWANVSFLAIFGIEAGVKIAAFGRRYFKDNWNNFDFTIVVLSVLIGTV